MTLKRNSGCADQSSAYIRLTMLTALLMLSIASSYAQNVGIGTVAPQRKLTVSGSIMLDQGNQNDGTLDTAALIFGAAGTVGINSKKTGSGSNGLSFWTGGNANLNISSTGNVGIGGASNSLYRLRVHGGNSFFDGDTHNEGSFNAFGNAAIGGNVDPAYRLRVYDGHTRFGGDMHATGNVTIGGDLDPTYKLRVIGGNSRFGGDLYATGNVAFGGDVDNAFRLRVWGGNSRFGGNVEITGNATVDNTLTTNNLNVGNSMTIDGKGSVRSNGPSPLRIGFDHKTVDVFIAANSAVWVTANITEFSGDNDDVRVFVSQITQDAGSSLSWSHIGINVMTPDPGTDTVIIWLHNRSGGNGILKGTFYLTTIAKN